MQEAKRWTIIKVIGEIQKGIMQSQVTKGSEEKIHFTHKKNPA